MVAPGGGVGVRGFFRGGGVRRIRRDTVNERAVRILLECILVWHCTNGDSVTNVKERIWAKGASLFYTFFANVQNSVYSTDDKKNEQRTRTKKKSYVLTHLKRKHKISTRKLTHACRQQIAWNRYKYRCTGRRRKSICPAHLYERKFK